MPVRYILSSVWIRLSIFSQLSIIQYVGLCIFSIPISLVMIERIYILCLIIFIKSEVWTITHCLGLGHETMVCAVCLSIFLHNITRFSGLHISHLPMRFDYCSHQVKAQKNHNSYGQYIALLLMSIVAIYIIGVYGYHYQEVRCVFY